MRAVFENRVGGADANPYIAIAASLCMRITSNDRELAAPPNRSPAAPTILPFGLPRSLDEALRKLRSRNRS